jgi:hypothetical protein
MSGTWLEMKWNVDSENRGPGRGQVDKRVLLPLHTCKVNGFLFVQAG